MERQEPATLRITSPAEAAQLIPYLVGFTPEESLVISAIQRGRVEVTARVDLAGVQAFGAVEDLLDRIWDRFPDADGFAVAYTDDHQAGWNLLQRCDGWLPNGCQRMLIDADTWHTPNGATGTIDNYGTISAQATYHGLPRLDRRADLEARFAGPPDSDQFDHQLGAALAELPAPNDTAKILTATGDLIAHNLPPAAKSGPDPHVKTAASLTQTDAIRLSVLAQHPAARDLALLSVDRDNSSQHLALWQGVIRASPAYGADMPLYLAGMAAWVSGDGASATIALERALQTNPQPGAAHPVRLLEGLIDQVVPPTAWPSIRDTVLADADPAVRDAIVTNPVRATHRRWAPIASPLGSRGPEQETHRPPTPGIAI